MADDKRDRRTGKPKADDQREQNMPPAGPHATEELTNEDATPGAGSLPDRKDTQSDTGGTG